MLRAADVLDAAVRDGHATSWERLRTKEYGHNVTRFAVKSDLFDISDETYGRTSMLYFSCASPSAAWMLFRFCQRLGGKPGAEWCGGPDKCGFDLRVSYFKGHHWYE